MNESETVPLGGTMTPSQVRKLKIAIAIMSVLLAVGLILFLVGIYIQAQKLATKLKEREDASAAAISQTPPANLDLAVTPGAELSAIHADQGRLILHLRTAGGSEIAIIDLASGREVQRIRLSPQESP
jgi:heme/copper-type cytochrome/quinol oxidase subunit 1